MANTKAESPQQQLLKRLLQTEAAARERRLQAQQQGETLQAESKEQIKQLLDNARTSANAEVERRRRQQQAVLDREIQQLAAANQSKIAAMQLRAAQQMDAAVGLIVDWVTGKAGQP